MEQSESPANHQLGTVDKAIDVLVHLSGEPEACGVTSVGRALGLPKSSVHRLLSALARRGLVERDARGRYRPGIGLVALGLGALEREPIAAAARAVLEEEAVRLGETVFLVVARAGALVVLDKAEGSGFLRAAPRLGSRVPVHATAAGKLYLALAPDQVGGEPRCESFTRHTLDASALAAEVEEAKRNGYAKNLQEWIPGLAVVAAPVVAGGRMQGAVAVATTAQRLEELGLESLGDWARAAGERIAARLEGRSR